MPASSRPLLHVGYHKTATTWLQTRFFAADDLGFYLSENRRDSLYAFVFPHALEFDPGEARAFYEAEWQRAAEGAVPVLSMERFSGTPHAARYDSAEIADRLARTFPEGRVLLVVREQEDLILSGYRQYVKNSGVLSLDDYLHPTYEPSVIHRFSYGAFFFDRLVGLYDRLFGRENVLVLPYEAFREDPVAFMRSVAAFVGLDPADRALERLRPRNRANASLSAAATSLKRWGNRVASRQSAINPAPLVRLSDRGAVLSRRFFYAVDRWLPDRLSRRLDARQRAFVRASVGTRYADSNAALADRMGVDLGRYGYRLPEGRPEAGADAGPDPSALTFHIVYTRGTVGLLTPFVASLLEHSPFRYRLVSNGCGPEERAALAELAATSPRLEALALPGDEVHLHSTGLDWLFENSSDPYFAFLDSDVFAVAPFGEAVRRALVDGPTFFSCAQPWASDADRSVGPNRQLSGRHLAAMGRRVGTTFFAVYQRDRVEQVRREYRVGFGKYVWRTLPPAVRGRFREGHLRFRRYDTAKVLTLLLGCEGARIHYEPLRALVHLGGVSDRAEGERRRHEPGPRRTARVWFRLLVRRFMRTVFGPTWPSPPGASFKDRRLLAWHYFGEAIPRLQAGEAPPPSPDFGDPAVQREMERVIGELTAFYRGAPPPTPVDDRSEVLSEA